MPQKHGTGALILPYLNVNTVALILPYPNVNTFKTKGVCDYFLSTSRHMIFLHSNLLSLQDLKGFNLPSFFHEVMVDYSEQKRINRKIDTIL